MECQSRGVRELRLDEFLRLSRVARLNPRRADFSVEADSGLVGVTHGDDVRSLCERNHRDGYEQDEAKNYSEGHVVSP